MRAQLKLDSDCKDVIVSLVIKAGIDCTSDLSFNFQTSPQSSGNSAIIIKSLFVLVPNLLKIDRDSSFPTDIYRQHKRYAISFGTWKSFRLWILCKGKMLLVEFLIINLKLTKHIGLLLCFYVCCSLQCPIARSMSL